MAPHQLIRWPEPYNPSRTAVHVRNELAMPAPPEAVWAWLVRAELWPSWYCNAHGVRIVGGPRPDLALGSRFRWRTFGVAIDSTVEECVPCERLAWTARGVGVRAYHAWFLRPAGYGCQMLTEETQNGWLARLGNQVMPDRMHRFHQIWLEALAQKAAGGAPPADMERIEVVDSEMAPHLRALSGAERLRIASGMFASARRMLTSHLATAHPDWDEERLQSEVARRLSGAG